LYFSETLSGAYKDRVEEGMYGQSEQTAEPKEIMVEELGVHDEFSFGSEEHPAPTLMGDNVESF